MPKLSLTNLGGLIPRTTPKMLPDNGAQLATNVKLETGRFVPLKDKGSSTALAGTVNQMYLWHRNSTTEWLTSTAVADWCKSPIKGDAYERIYYLDSGTIKMHLWDSSKVSRTVGLTAPASAPTVTTDPYSAWTFDPRSGATACTLSVKQTLATIGETDNITQAAALLTYRMTDDGKCVLRFRVPGYKFTTYDHGSILAAYGRTYTCEFALTVGSLGSIPTAGVSATLKDNSLSITAAAVEYARMEVDSVTPIGRTISWNEWDDVTAARTYAAPMVSDWIVEITANMNYTDYSNDGLSRAVYYCYSHVNDYGEESPVSPISKIVNLRPGQKAILGGLANPASPIVNNRIYRSAAGTNEDAWFLVATQAKATSTYTDTKEDAELIDVMPLLEAPPTSLDGLGVSPNGFMFAYDGKTVYFSEPWLPYSWPDKYQMTVEHDVLAHAVAGNDIILLTKGHPVIVSGSHPQELTQAVLPLPQAAANHEAACVLQNAAFYVSPDGIVMIRGGDATIVTDKFYTRTQWQALTPASMVMASHDNKVHCIAGATHLIFDFDEGLGTLTTSDIVGTAMWSDLEGDTLYLAITGPNAAAWEGSATSKQGTWQSKEFYFDRPIAWQTARVVADTYQASPNHIQLLLYGNGSLITTQTVSSKVAWRLPKMRKERTWSLKILSKDPVDEITLSTSMEGLR